MTSYIAKVYADLIRKGEKTFNDVPEKLKEQVKQALIDMGREDLAEE
jgi:hypothetical protein